MFEISETERFSSWLFGLKDLRAKAKILVRIARARKGNFGDSEAVGRGVSEMRIFVGKGYRVYYTKTGKNIVWLLCGGDKSSQQKDIKQAIEIKESI